MVPQSISRQLVFEACSGAYGTSSAKLRGLSSSFPPGPLYPRGGRRWEAQASEETACHSGRGAVSVRLEQLHGGRHAHPCTVHHCPQSVHRCYCRSHLAAISRSLSWLGDARRLACWFLRSSDAIFELATSGIQQDFWEERDE